MKISELRKLIREEVVKELFDTKEKIKWREGDMLNKIDSEIETLLKKRQEIEIKLAY